MTPPTTSRSLLLLLSLLGLSACPSGTDDDDSTTDDDDSTTDDDDTTGDDDDSAGDDDDDTTGTPGDADGDGSLDEDDCNDADATVFPGAVELCDGVDQNCVVDVEDGLATFFPTVGAGIDLTTPLSTGGESTVSENGMVRLCGGTWSGHLILAAGTTVTVLGEPGHAMPLFGTANAVALSANGAATVRDVEFESCRIDVGRGGSAVVEDSVLATVLVFMYPTGILELRRTAVSAQAGSYFIAGMNDFIDDQPREVLIEDSVLTDMYSSFAGNMHLIFRDSELAGTSALGAVTDLLMEDSTTAGSFSVLGDGTGSAVIRRVTGTMSGPTTSLSNLVAVTIEDLDVTSLDGSTIIGITDVGTVTVQDSSFVNNAPASGRFAIGFDGTGQTEMVASVGDTTFDGAGINAVGPTFLTVSDSAFTGTGDSAVRAYLTHAVTVSNSTFTNCDAGTATGTQFDASGGAVYAQVDGYVATVTDSTITGGHANAYGGGVFLNGGTLVLDGIAFDGNTASSRGGGVMVQAGTAVITNTTFEDGVATFGGGGLCALGGTVTVTGGSFLRNTTGSSIWGGGLSVGGGTVNLVAVDLGTGVDDNGPADIDWNNGFGGYASYNGVTTLVCTGDGCN